MSMEINEMQEMNERAKQALEYHKKGYNCSQAVAYAVRLLVCLW